MMTATVLLVLVGVIVGPVSALGPRSIFDLFRAQESEMNQEMNELAMMNNMFGALSERPATEHHEIEIQTVSNGRPEIVRDVNIEPKVNMIVTAAHPMKTVQPTIEPSKRIKNEFINNLNKFNGFEEDENNDPFASVEIHVYGDDFADSKKADRSAGMLPRYMDALWGLLGYQRLPKEIESIKAKQISNEFDVIKPTEAIEQQKKMETESPTVESPKAEHPLEKVAEEPKHVKRSVDSSEEFMREFYRAHPNKFKKAFEDDDDQDDDDDDDDDEEEEEDDEDEKPRFSRLGLIKTVAVAALGVACVIAAALLLSRSRLMRKTAGGAKTASGDVSPMA